MAREKRGGVMRSTHAEQHRNKAFMAEFGKLMLLTTYESKDRWIFIIPIQKLDGGRIGKE